MYYNKFLQLDVLFDNFKDKVCRIFLLKFSTKMLIRTMNGTLTHNVLRICAVRIR
jgi:hypothetical protein